MAEKFTVTLVIEAVRAAKGLITVAARALGCEPQTVRNYAKRYPSVRQAIADEREMLIDIGELSLYRKVQDGEGWAVCFLLKTLGKERGYIERDEHQHSGPGGGPIPVREILVALHPDDRDDPALPAPANGAASA